MCIKLNHKTNCVSKRYSKPISTHTGYNDRFATGEGVALLLGEGGNLSRVELDAVASAINQGTEEPGIVGDTSSGRGGRWQSGTLPEQGGGSGASLGHGKGLGTRGLSGVEKLVWEAIVHLATWCL